MGNGSCMGDIDCEMDQPFSGPVSDFRNSVGSGGAPKSAWNGREKSSVVSSKYEAIVEVGGITYYNEHSGAGDTNARAEDKRSGERSLDIVGATERSEGASNTFRIKTVDYQASKPQENFVDFTIRAGQLLVSHADRTGFEHCYCVCGSDSPGTQGKPDFEAKIVTIESHVGCGTSSTMCSVGYVDFGYSNHAHGNDAFRVNDVDVKMYGNLRKGSRVSDQDRYNPSPADYMLRRGFLSTPSGVIRYRTPKDH